MEHTATGPCCNTPFHVEESTPFRCACYTLRYATVLSRIIVICSTYVIWYSSFCLLWFSLCHPHHLQFVAQLLMLLANLHGFIWTSLSVPVSTAPYGVLQCNSIMQDPPFPRLPPAFLRIIVLACSHIVVLPSFPFRLFFFSCSTAALVCNRGLIFVYLAK